MTTKSLTIAILSALAGMMASSIVAYAQTPKSIKIGYAISLSGPNTAVAIPTVLSNYNLWIKDVNAAGGIMLKSVGKRVPIEVVEYDDRDNVDSAVEAVERLITQDKVDFILPPWGTGLNLAVGPQLNRAGYPHLISTALNDRVNELSKLWPNSFWLTGTVTDGVQAVVSTIAKLRSDGKISNTVAVLSVADQFGIGLAKSARRALKKEGFEIVYDRSYPVGARDMSAVMAEVKQVNPDSFVAFSYPPDTVAITEQARVINFNPKVFYAAIGTAYPFYKRRFGSDIEGVMGLGGWSASSPEGEAYLKHYKETTGSEPDRGAGPIAYASLQMLQQSIERVGKIDRAAVSKELQTGTFETILGQIKLENNINKTNSWVGQWQNGEFQGIVPATSPGAQQITFPKPAWKVD